MFSGSVLPLFEKENKTILLPWDAENDLKDLGHIQNSNPEVFAVTNFLAWGQQIFRLVKPWSASQDHWPHEISSW